MCIAFFFLSLCHLSNSIICSVLYVNATMCSFFVLDFVVCLGSCFFGNLFALTVYLIAGLFHPFPNVSIVQYLVWHFSSISFFSHFKCKKRWQKNHKHRLRISSPCCCSNFFCASVVFKWMGCILYKHILFNATSTHQVCSFAKQHIISQYFSISLVPLYAFRRLFSLFERFFCLNVFEMCLIRHVNCDIFMALCIRHFTESYTFTSLFSSLPFAVSLSDFRCIFGFVFPFASNRHITTHSDNSKLLTRTIKPGAKQFKFAVNPFSH